MKRILAFGLVGAWLLLPIAVQAINPPAPHDRSKGVTCDSCHLTHRDKANMTGSDYYNNVCLSCHRPGDATGGGKPLTLGDVANPGRFSGYTASSPEKSYQTSHRWTGFLSTSSAGARVPLGAASEKVGITGNQLGCIVCHNQHDNTYGKFLRGANDSDQLCRDCHRDRDRNTDAGGSHPVMVNYSATAAAKPDAYRKTPLNANPANASSNLGAHLKGGQVVCSTCHGLHYSDSRSSTVDAAANFVNLSSGDGNLLRTDKRGNSLVAANRDSAGAVDYLNLCTNCHAGKFTHNGKGQNIQCTDCHGAHAIAEGTSVNLKLIRRYMQVSSSKGKSATKKAVFTATANNYRDATETGVCQSCHKIPDWPEDHSNPTGCSSCHAHDAKVAAGGSFGMLAGCTTCHGYPPGANLPGAGGYAGNYFSQTGIDESNTPHARHAGAGSNYSYTCRNCHQGNTHNKGTFQDLFISPANTKATLFDATPAYDRNARTCSGVYCHSNGAPRNAALTPTLMTATTPSWAGGAGAITGCSACHAAQPRTNAHPRHIAYEYACDVCHNATASNSSTISDRKRHGDGIKDVVFSQAAGSITWNEPTATCAGGLCHSNGNGGPANLQPVWTGSLPADCSGCHGGAAASGSPITTGKHAAHTNNAAVIGTNFDCIDCHAWTVGNNTTIANPVRHANGYVDYSGARARGSANFNASTHVCSSIYCHSDGKGTSIDMSGAAWNSATTLDCKGCHGATASSTGEPDYANGGAGAHRANSHQKHTVNGAASCDTCHTWTTTNGTAINYGSRLHADGQIDVTFNAAKATATWTAGTKSCSNISCHMNASATWGANMPADCSGCHGGDAASGSPLTTGNHVAHTNNAAVIGTNFGCTDCHAKTVSANRVIANAAGHMNGMVDYSGAKARGSASYSTSTHECSALYCHSDGKGTGKSLAAAAWNSATTLDCRGCHGSDQAPAFTSQAGEPNYANVTTTMLRRNSHRPHTKTGAASCDACHTNTTANGVSIKSGSALHVNGAIDIGFNGAKAGAGSAWNASNKTCSGTGSSCHFGGSAKWGAKLPSDCAGCHGNDAASANPISAGKHQAHVNNAAVLGSGNNFGCAVCHASTVFSNHSIATSANHGNTIKNYSGARAGRIATAGTGACSQVYCHSTGMPANQFWNMTTANWYSAKALACTGCHGTPKLADGAFAAFTSVAGEPNYANMTGIGQRNSHRRHIAKAGIADSTGCVVCHATTVDAAVAGKLRDYSTAHLDRVRNVAFSASIQGRYSSTTQQCLNTYCHGPAATPAWGSPSLACNQCHEASNALGGGHDKHWNSATPATSYAAAPGNSDTSGATYQFACSSCHSTPAVHGNGIAHLASGAVAQVYFGYSVAGRKGAYGYGASSVADSRGFRHTAGARATCNSTYCHSNGNGAFANNTSYSWNSASGTLGCAGCHGGNAASAAPIATGKHAAHTHNAAVIGTNFGCVECHAGTVSIDTNISNRYRHVNRLKDYTGAQAGSYTASTRSCSDVYCHSNGKQGTAAQAYVDPAAWNSGATVSCNGCHGTGNAQGAPDYASGAAGSATANSHVRHVVTNDKAVISCNECHYLTTRDNSSIRGNVSPSRHIDRVASDVFFNLSGSNASGAYDHSARSCTNVYCHSNGAPFDKANDLRSVSWGGTAMTCTSCHDGASDASGLSGRHAKHTAPSSYAFACERCHLDTVTGSATIKDQGLHINKAKDVAFSWFTGRGNYNGGTKACTNNYCHSNGRGGAPTVAVKWSDTTNEMKCFSCHKGQTANSTLANCNAIQGSWSSAKGYCTPDLTMASNGHHRLVGPQWIRKYPCYYCHNATMDTSGNIKDKTKHVNGAKNIMIAPQWNIVGRPEASFNPTTKVCDNVYCHSDGTTDSEQVRPIVWTEPKTECNSCHGHPRGTCANAGCHDGRTDGTGKVWTVKAGWPAGAEWMAAMPMFANQGAGTARANSHTRHSQTYFTCDQCHATTIRNGACTTCHIDSIPEGSMRETAHIDATYHVDKTKEVVFRDGGTYNVVTKTCSGTACHSSGVDPVWGASVNSSMTCLNCHGTAGPDQDDYNAFNGTQARMSLGQWTVSGHGRYSSSGPYPVSGNPAANFPGNPCWYCHDNKVFHKDKTNPFRLKMHSHYERRFEKECVYCHMSRTDAECLGCHVGQAKSLAPQATGSGIVFKRSNGSTETRFPSHTYSANCTNGGCHDSDSGTFPGGEQKGHNVNAGIWTADQKADIKNQYLMMGVCLQCHDDDSGGQCTSCHEAPPENPNKYSLGYDPGTGKIKPKKARASSGHFGHKHYRAFKDSGGWTKIQSATKSPIWGTYSTYAGTWKGGKFCWDCHDAHGDSNIYMIQSKVATTTDGLFGIPKTRADVTFTDKQSGTNYARKVAPFDGICNACHAPGGRHYTSNSGDGHNLSRPCTNCHEHRFADSHANRRSCSTEECHSNAKPVPKHTAFGLPRDCTKCHLGTVGKRMDVIGQMKSNSHHVQRASGEIKSSDCYQCHWESNKNGLINIQYHAGYNYKNYSSVKDDVVDLVVWGPGVRPSAYREYSTVAGRKTVARFLAKNMGTSQERSEVAKITNHCISCHSDQNNESMPFDDCKTPRQYAWDGQSVAARYGQTGTAAWGKYPGTANAAKKNFTKAFSAHGNAAANQGGWDATNGLDGDLTGKNMRTGSKSVQCFDCHNSHGSKVVGITSSYVTYNGTFNGANLKETKQNIGGYAYDYKASSNASGANPYAAGAGQCFDCHNSPTAGTVVPAGKTPWGYFSTYSSSSPVMGYKDTPRFGNGTKASIARNNAGGWRDSRKTIKGGHLKASEPAGSLPNLAKDVGTASGGSATTVVDGGKNWSANKWQHLYVLMTSGVNSGQLSKITANTATTLTVEGFAAAVASGDGYKIVPYSHQVNGLCTPCHDPHGVSPTLGAKQAYAVPLLKGTWMTSPYKEDLPPPTPTGSNVTTFGDGSAQSWGQYRQGTPTPTQPTARYNLDRTTFSGSTRISENDDSFGGLCLNCHAKPMLTDGSNKNQNWKTVDRIHETVKGWGANTEHSYSCSKCHQPHNSGLPRLMQTNCLDVKHRASRTSGGQAWRADSESGSAHGSGNQHRGYPLANTYGNSASYEATASCHSSAPLNGGTWPDKNLWNNVTPW